MPSVADSERTSSVLPQARRNMFTELARWLANDLASLVRWAGRARPAVDLLLLDEDRRSLRAIVRGLAGGLPAPLRIASAIPTPSLPPALLERLSRASRREDLVALLSVEPRHPFATALAIREGDLLALELSLARTLVACAAELRGRDAAIEQYTSWLVDGENACMALVLASRGDALDRDACFLAGGKRLDRETFACGDGERLARAFTGTAVAQAVAARMPSLVEDAVLDEQLAEQAELRSSDPTCLATVLHFWLTRRARARELCRVATGA